MIHKLKTCFFGTPDFSLPSLKVVHEHTNLVAVVTQPDKARGRKQLVTPSAVKKLALNFSSTQIFTPASLKKDSDELRRLWAFLNNEKPDLFVVVAYGNILPKDFLDFPKLASVNLHASLLPRWRGAAPIQRALEAGDATSGVSLQKMVEELDAGDVLLEKSLALSPSENASTLSVCLSEQGAELLKEFIHKLSTGGQMPPAQPQDKNKVTLASKIKKEEGFWDSSWSAAQSIGRIAAFYEWPGVRACVSTIDGSNNIHLPEFVIFKEAAPFNEKLNIRPGELEIMDKRVLLACSDSAIELRKIQIPASSTATALSVFQNLLSKTGQTRLKVTKFSTK